MGWSTWLRKGGAVAVPAGGERDRADVRGGGVHGQMDLAPRALFAIGLDPMAPQWLGVQQQVQHPVGTARGDLNPRGLLSAAQRGVVRHGPVQPRDPQQPAHPPGRLRQLVQNPASTGRTGPRRGTGEHRWTPRCPSHGACQATSLSSQISRDPRLRSPELQATRLVVRQRALLGKLMPPVQPHGLAMSLLHSERSPTPPTRRNTRDLCIGKFSPLAPRRMRLEIDERMGTYDTVVTPLSQTALNRQTDDLRALPPEAVAICLPNAPEPRKRGSDRSLSARCAARRPNQPLQPGGAACP